MNQLYENIKKYRKQAGMTQDELAKKAGYTDRSSIAKIESGHVDLMQSKIKQFADIFGVSPSELMGLADDQPRRPLPAGLLPVEMRRIPIIGHVAAGVPIMAEREYEEYEDDTYGIACDYVLRVEGDSMEPRILDGDVVYVRQQPDVDDGQIAVVGVDDSVTLKVIYHMPGGLQLVSLNPKYKPMLYTQDNTDYLAIIGKAVAFKRRL